MVLSATRSAVLTWAFSLWGSGHYYYYYQGVKHHSPFNPRTHLLDQSMTKESDLGLLDGREHKVQYTGEVRQPLNSATSYARATAYPVLA